MAELDNIIPQTSNEITGLGNSHYQAKLLDEMYQVKPLDNQGSGCRDCEKKVVWGQRQAGIQSGKSQLFWVQ